VGAVDRLGRLTSVAKARSSRSTRCHWAEVMGTTVNREIRTSGLGAKSGSALSVASGIGPASRRIGRTSTEKEVRGSERFGYGMPAISMIPTAARTSPV
jgi:hypothetical protein